MAAIDSRVTFAEAFCSAMPFARKKNPNKQSAAAARWHPHRQQGAMPDDVLAAVSAEPMAEEQSTSPAYLQ